ncbi:hypothetical protein Indivirus_2_59 [Indivirus ILV1]|uniref:OTU domain-containing protein n=1 Tax=Indivirus ILV1 TaxID=1977633 RepID=A0A1V0SD78_9VIRU|nr:hypothetical protein Indivirus_2_59 [Indivirus ILV1]
MTTTDFKYPRKLNTKIWEEYIGRPLTVDEKCLIEMCKSEKYMNKMMNDLYGHLEIKQNKYHIPKLTSLDGNCLFESLNYHKIGNNVEELRTMLSMVFYIFQNYQNFLPNMESTLIELFNCTNEIEYVSTYENKEKVYYKYSYAIMCQDLGNLTCWSRLPTQLILLVVSYLFNVEIIIINSNTGYETKINIYELDPKSEIRTIYLGHLGESHYVPLDTTIPNKYPIYYDNAMKNLIEWGKVIENIKTEQFMNTQNIIIKNELNQSNEFEKLEYFSEMKIENTDMNEVNF